MRKKFLDMEFSNLNSPQRDAVFHVDGNLLVLAGAGSGKTTVIVNRIYNMIVYGNLYNSEEIDCDAKSCKLLSEGLKNGKKLSEFSDIVRFNPISPENILAITFTNKASKEIKDRLNKR